MVNQAENNTDSSLTCSPISSDNKPLRGQYELTLDEKGRLTVIADFRRKIGSDIVLKRNLVQQCIELLPASISDQYLEKLSALSTMDPDVLGLLTVEAANTRPANIDKQGRVCLPADMRRAVGVDSEVVLTGACDRLKIWSPLAWEQYQANINVEALKKAVYAKYQL